MATETPVVPLREVPPDEWHQREVVTLLRDLLERAERGEVSGCLVLLERAGTTEIESRWTASRDCVWRLGALEILRSDWIRSWREG